MTSRAEFRALFVRDLLPAFAQAAEDAGLTRIVDTATRWAWRRTRDEGVHAEVHLRESTGRHTRDGIDVHAHAGIVVDTVERTLRTRTERHPDAMTLTAPLRSWGTVHSPRADYPLRWDAGDPAGRMEEMIRDLGAFTAFADTVHGAGDIRPERLARSRIRRQWETILVPGHTAIAIEVIGELTAPAP